MSLRRVLDEVLDEVKPIVELRAPSMGYRAGPRSITAGNSADRHRA
jgi:hypothetical protein